MDSEVEVIQADREAAASVAEWQRDTGWEPCFFHHDFARGVREGAWDNHDLVQAFARHRTQSTQLDGWQDVRKALEAALVRADDTPGRRISILRLAITDAIAALPPQQKAPEE
jgi:hypothetical protein